MNKKELKLLERGFIDRCYFNKKDLAKAITSCKRNNEKYIVIVKHNKEYNLTHYCLWYRKNQTLIDLEIENVKLKNKLEQIKQDFYKLKDTLEV